MITIYKRTVKEKTLNTIDKVEVGSWLNVVDPTDEELEKLAKDLKLDLETLKDGLDEDELSRIEKEGKTTYLIIRSVAVRDGVYTTTPILLIITEKNIVTLSKRDNETLSLFLKAKLRFFTTQKTQFVLNFLLDTINKYDRYIKRISKEVKSKRFNLDKLDNKDILSLVHYEETINDFLSSFAPIVGILDKILRGRYIRIYPKDEDIVEDLAMDSKQTLQSFHDTLKSIRNIREAYSAILTNSLNKVMKLLTAMTIILTIPTVISSIYGMNVDLPLQRNPFAFFQIVGGALMIAILLTILFIKKKWI